MDTRVLNISNGHRLRPTKALKLVKDCTCKWVEGGVSVRNLTLAESIQARNEQAAARALESEVLISSEVGGCRFIPPPTTSYRTPWEEIEELCAPMMVRRCHWPRPVSA